jgi:hypothetical protein
MLVTVLVKLSAQNLLAFAFLACALMEALDSLTERRGSP